MKSLINKIILLLFSLSIVLILDYFIGQTVLDFISNDPEKKIRTTSLIYHHDLRKNIDKVSKWGPYFYRVCTDNSGFKVDCKYKNTLNKEFDIGFIGDSFTEGIGLNYEDTFVGMYQNYNNNLKIANLGVASYSPSIYYSKINELLKNGYSFKKVIVFIDISDIQDEAVMYRLDGDIVVSADENLKNYQLKRYLNNLFPITYNGLLNIKYANNLFSQNKKFHEDIYSKHFERAGWTWGIKTGYGNLGVEGGINKSIENMNKLYYLLKNNNIDLILAVYPWPGQILHDRIDSKQVTVWRNFCINKCTKFIDLFPLFNSRNDNPKNIIKKYYIANDVHFNKNANTVIFNHLDTLEIIKK